MSTLLLKIIACLTMLGDHIGYFSYYGFSELETVLRASGRIAFPIFCYLIAFGYRKTHNKYIYFARLAVLGLISELPYQYCFHGAFPAFDFGNVYFTLSLGLAAIILFDLMLQSRHIFLKYLSWVPVVLLAGAAQLLVTDYSADGVLLIFFMYLAIDSKLWTAVCCIVFSARKIIYAVVASFFEFRGVIDPDIGNWDMMQLFAAAALIPILLCNGSRGFTPKSKAGRLIVQYGFYFFYPVHILLIGLIMRNYLM